MATRYPYKRFSKAFSLYDEWEKAQKREAAYVERIRRLHILYPNATLTQLRGHALEGERELSRTKRINALRNLEAMTHRQRDLYENKVLRAILKLRIERGRSLRDVARELETTPETILRYAPSAFRKTAAGWEVKKSDRLVRIMKFYDASGSSSVTLDSSTQASLVGTYHHAVKTWVEQGDDSALHQFEGRNVRDAKGKLHPFITDRRLLKKFARSGELRFETIYYA